MDVLKLNTSASVGNDITPKMIVFKADEKQHCFETISQNVTVIGSTGNHDHGSSKIKLKNIVDYKWEVKNYPGRLIAVHIDGKHIAYAIKVTNTDGGMVRVTNLSTGSRALIKGMSSEVLDLHFAHLKSEILLGCIEQSALHVHKIQNIADKVECISLLKIEDPKTGYVPTYDKINWCPFVPEDESDIDEYVSQQLVWVRGNTYQCYSVRSVLDKYGIGIHVSKNLVEGSLKHKESTIITGATFSPDGTTLCVSCEDGIIRFYQIYFHTNEKNPRCLHQWTPHGGKPITSFYFLDNHTEFTSDSLWKHAITTSDNNTEIKVWCCSTWECKQTINFKSPKNAELFFRAEIDRTSSYLVLSDIKNRGLYVLQIYKDQHSGTRTKTNKDDDLITTPAATGSSVKNTSKSLAYIKSISEFPLSSPILSFGIADAAVRKYKCSYNDSYLLDELDDYDEDNNSLYCVVIHLFMVQPKSVQECHILYQPTVHESSDVLSSLSDITGKDTGSVKSIGENDDAVERRVSIDNTKLLKTITPKLSLDNSALAGSVNLITSPKSNKSENNSILQPKPSTQINLVTPDSFNSPPGKLTPEGVSNEVLSTILMLAKVASPPDAGKKKAIESRNILNLVNNKVIEEQEQQKIRQSVELKLAASVTPSLSTSANILAASVAAAAASGGSSPSREVQEILSLKDSDCLNEFYDDPGDLLDENDGESIDDKILVDSYNFNETTVKDANSKDKTKISALPNKNDWPKVPQVPSSAMSNLHCTNFNNMNNTSNSNLIDINYKLDQVMEIMQTQSCQISELKNALEMKSNNNTKLETLSKNIEFNLSKLIEEYLIRYEREHKQKLEAFISERDKQNRDLRDNILHAVTQVVCNQITERVSAIMITELQRHTLPVIMGKLDAIKTQIQIDVSQKLTSCDQLFKDNIAKICTNKTTMDTFGASVVLGVQKGLNKTYTDTLKTTLIPSYEKLTEEMFKRIQEVFVQGTKSYTTQFGTYIAQYKPQNEEIMQLLNEMPEQIKTISDRTVTNCTTQINSDLNKDLKALQMNLIKSIRDNVRNEIQKGFESQAATIEDSVMSVVRSQAQTPAPSIFDVQEQIKQFLAQGQTNKAFHQALVANDLTLVEFTLEKADYKTVFNPCMLQQTVLLSLIQQISADMSNHNELKQRYLGEAILNLNLADPTTKEHAPKILRELFQHCQNYTATNPNSSGVKMLMMAIQGLGIKLF